MAPSCPRTLKSASSVSSIPMRGGTSQTKNQGRGGGSIGKPTAQGRIFAMNQQDTSATPDVVTGMLPLFGKRSTYFD